MPGLLEAEPRNRNREKNAALRQPDLTGNGALTMNLLNIFSKPKDEILVLDDEPFITELLEVTLRTAGYRIHLAHHPEEARTILQNANVRLIVTDIRMPDQNGIDFIRSIKKTAQFKDVPVFFMSGYYSKKELTKLMNRFPNIRIFPKPLEMPELVKATKEVLEGSKSREQ